MNRKKILLLGDRGKMGTALDMVFSKEYTIIGKNTDNLNAFDLNGVCNVIEEIVPDIVINTIAFVGIDACDREPQKAFILNSLLPKVLAELSMDKGFVLIHFSTEAVFSDREKYYTESDIPHPVNVYGFTKYGGDCFIQALAKNYYIFRLPLLFGEVAKKTQFVEKMLERVRAGEKVLKISDDIFSSPSYSLDIAFEAKRILEEQMPFGLFHLANDGKASLYDLMKEIIGCLNLDVEIHRASHKDFPSRGIKNTHVIIRSEKIKPLRDWREAVKEYCSKIKF